MQRPKPEIVTLKDILITEQLSQRSSRPPNWQAEAEAMRSLAQQMARDSANLMQTLADTALELCQAGTAGVSLLETTPNGEEIFRWTVLAGTLAHYVGGSTPRNFSPCGVCLEQGSPVLFSHPERYFTYFQDANTPIVEGLVLPLIADRHVFGTIWIMSHDEHRHFDSEDVRVMTSLADFTATTLLLNQRQIGELLAVNVALETEIAERKQTEAQLSEAQRRLELSLTGADLGIWTYRVGTGEFWADDRAKQMHGHEPHEVHTFAEAGANIHPEDRDRAQAAFAQAIQDRSKLQIEYRAVWRDGSIRWIASYAELISSDRDEGIFYGVAQDISDRIRVECDRKRAEAALRESEAQLAADLAGMHRLYELHAKLSNETDLHTALEEILVTACEFTNTERGCVQFVSEDGERLEMVAHRGYDEDSVFVEYFRHEGSKVACDMARQHGERLIVEDTETFPPLVGTRDREVMLAENIRATQSTPMVTRQGEMVGVLSTQFPQPHRPTDDELRFVDLLAWTAADFVSRHRAEAAVEANLKDTRLLHHLAMQVSNDGQGQELYDRILDAGIALMHADMGSLQILDSDRNELQLQTWKGFHPEAAAFWQWVGLEAGGSCSAASRQGERVLVPDVEACDFMAGTADLDFFHLCGIKAVQSTPLISRSGQLIGMFSTHWCKTYQPSDRELRFLDLLARQAADLIEQRRAEVALRESEAKYRSLFTTMDQGFCIIEKVETAPEQPSNFRYITVNPAFEHHTGMHDVVGKTIREFVPDVEQRIMDIYDAVVRTGQPQQFEDYVSALDLWIAAEVFPTQQPGQIAVLFSNISERKRAEQQLRRAAEIDAFRVKLSDALRSLSDPIEVQQVAERMLGEALAVERVFYAEVDHERGEYVIADNYANGVPKIVGQFRLTEFGQLTEILCAGQTVVFNNIHTPPILPEAERTSLAQMGIVSCLAVPLIKAGRYVAALGIHHFKPREWSETELAFVSETAERTWAAVERACAEAALRQSEEQFRLLVTASSDIIHKMSADWSEMRNLEGKNILASTTNPSQTWIETYIPQAEQPRVWAAIQEAICTKSTFELEHRVIQEDGTIGWTFSRAIPMLNEQGEIIEWFGAASDVTERKQAEAELRESEIQRIREQAAREEERQRAESLAELDRAKTLFFSNVSHEFRTPLTLLLAPLQDALSDPTLAPPQRERLKLAHRNSLRLLKLVNTLLDFSRIEAGRMEAVYEPTDLATFTTELASVFRSAIERAGLQLIVDCPPLPEPVYIDREMWEKIVLNLLSNAFKFTFDGEIRVSLYSTDSNQAILQIQDTGTGIAPEHLPHLFERFYQVRGTQARTHDGSGIGLALVHELVQLQVGTIEVSSTLGEGTCFTIALLFGTEHLPSDRLQDEGDRIPPARTLASTAMGTAAYVEEAEQWLPTEENRERTIGTREEQSASISDSSLPTHALARILLVDDNADMREYLTRILSEHVQVEAVADGATALAVAQTRVPDLILSDVMMPGLNGFELLQALRSDPRTREVPIILLSARAGEEAIVVGLEAGADDYLIKPFSAQELVSRVTAHLQMAQLRGEALQEARSTIRRRDEFISIVSHELNTPLVSILGWTRLLRANPPNPAMLIKALDTIERNATLQGKLVQDLLDISRITVGKLRLNPQPVELPTVIETAIASVAQTAADKGIDLTWQKTVTRSVVVMGDRDRLSQVLINLLTNAIKFTPESGSVRVELSVMNNDAADTSYAEIRVTDTGIGIAADFLPYVFDRFRQAEGTDAAKGLGLGLTISRHIVELHNGTIHADSAGEGQGASFTVRLPLL